MTAPLPPLPPVPPLGPIPGTSTTGGPSIADPTGLRYDRADLEDAAPAGLPPGVDGFAVTGRRSAGTFTMPVKPCCGDRFINDECDCAEFAEQARCAEVVVWHRFDLRELAARHITAAELDRRERGAA
ncbi:hypothetical protein E1258_27680 [Micromonospora sp. KC207]|nr:hypothetical protein E1258_27680 [Micromonospora sp. KC207]